MLSVTCSGKPSRVFRVNRNFIATTASKHTDIRNSGDSSQTRLRSLIKKLINDEYDGTTSIREHIRINRSVANEIKKFGVEVSDDFLVHSIKSTLPSEFMLNVHARDWVYDELRIISIEETSTCHFCRKSGHIQKNYPTYLKWLEKKGIKEKILGSS
ncbi:unnamed protein product [Urochloa decumbens]|uniref:Uncharacterized protein n=1 Tax=Urochloa decumbens TaxID=240449 RepID=A0ABC9H4D0_9POAL